MADSIGGYTSAEQVSSNYEKYKDFFATSTETTLGQMDFLSLMVAQMQNQDFTNPMDNSQFIAQMAQFSTLQAMTDLTYYSQSTYITSLIGKTVNVATLNSAGELETDTGVVEKINLNGTEFEIIVNGKTYGSSNIMSVVNGSSSADTSTDGDKNDTTEGEDTGSDNKTEAV